MKRIVLISCVSQKQDKAAKVRELYTSPLFTSSLAYAEQLRPDAVYVLSALHHLLELDQVIQPYDITLCYVPKNKRKPGLKILSAQEKMHWGKEVVRQLAQIADLGKDEFIVLAGQQYIKPLKGCIKNLKEPLKGLFQGQRISFLQAKVLGR